MHVVRYWSEQHHAVRVGVQSEQSVRAISGVGSVAELLRLRLEDIRALVEAANGEVETSTSLLAPVDGRIEIWAAGVTYQRSMQARQLESEVADVYDRVYQAARPELFFKSVAWRVCGPADPVAIREDSAVNVPEPELAVVINRHAEIVGYTLCNDMSSRSIEGENPLYLPQAKLYLGSCAVGPSIRPAWTVPDPTRLSLGMTIRRGGDIAWSGAASTADLARTIDELVWYLHRADEFPDGVVLSTGTCLVPDLPFTLEAGDEVTIEIESVGTMTNPVVRGKRAMRWMVDRLESMRSAR